MFRSAIFKMTALYLAIIMLISGLFSVSLFQISKQEIERSIHREQQFFNRGGRLMMPFADNELEQQKQEQLASAEESLFWQLVYINIAILFVAGGASYFFARLTLKPIEESHEKQKRFTADASHELRTPLAAMKAEIEVVLRDKKANGKDYQEILKSNLEEVGKMQLLVSSLLSLARDAKDVKLEKQKIKASPVVDEVSKKYRKLKGATIDNQVAHDQEVLADPTYFSELISILVDNAVKYSQEKVEVVVRAAEHGKHVEIQVIDHGVGISEKDLPHIFDRFYRCDNSRSKNKVEGYGLGLSLAKKIVQLHGGEIGARSKLGEGTTFIVRLPQ